MKQQVRKVFYLERELIDGIDLIQVVQNEVHERGSSSGWSIQLPCLVDLDLCDLCLLNLDLDLCGSALGGLKILHQGGVAEEVAFGRGHAGEEVVLKLLEDDLEVILLLGQVRLDRGWKGFSFNKMQCFHI